MDISRDFTTAGLLTTDALLGRMRQVADAAEAHDMPFSYVEGAVDDYFALSAEKGATSKGRREGYDALRELLDGAMLRARSALGPGPDSYDAGRIATIARLIDKLGSRPEPAVKGMSVSRLSTLVEGAKGDAEGTPRPTDGS